MNNSLLKQILNEYDQKRTKAILEAEQRKKELLEVNPKLSEIEKQLSNISIQAAKSILISEPKEKQKLLQNLKKQTNALLKEKIAFLKQLSKDSSYLNPHFECKLCKDTGYIEKNGVSTMCNCLKQKIFDIQYNKSNIGNLDKENFDTFDFNVYSDKPNIEMYNSNISPRENMHKIYDACQNFIKNFDNPDEKNLMFLGPTGLGKTFLSNCMAKKLLESGKTVLYQTAPVMLDNIISARFDKDQSSSFVDNLLNVDLLIIDDLGTETMNSMKFTELFTIINTRLLNQNNKITKTIISTNLDLKSIFKIYNERIGSRIAGHYNIYRFFGDDIRLKSKK